MQNHICCKYENLDVGDILICVYVSNFFMVEYNINPGDELPIIRLIEWFDEGPEFSLGMINLYEENLNGYCDYDDEDAYGIRFIPKDLLTEKELFLFKMSGNLPEWAEIPHPNGDVNRMPVYE